MSPLGIILFISSHLIWIWKEICRDQALFTSETSQNSPKQIHWWILMWQDNRVWTFLLEEALLWIIDSYNLYTNMQLFTLQDISWWTGLLVDYCDVFISCLISRSDGTHSLQRIYWLASDVMLISPNLFDV